MKALLQKDELTGLFTRRSFMEYLEEALEKHETTQTTASMAFVDVDMFKPFNDKEGHLMGDELLKQLAEILCNNTREGDLICRFGGDEFALYLPNTSSEVALILLEEIRKLVDDSSFILKVQERIVKTKITLSIGISSYPRDAKNITELVRKSDEALYRAKVEGRNRVRLAMPEERMKSKTTFYTAKQVERLSIIAKETKKSESFLLREALDNLIKKYSDLKEAEDTLLEVEVGKDLVKLVDAAQDGSLLKEIPHIREGIEKKFNVILPGIRFRDNLTLPPLEYVIIVREEIVARRGFKEFNDETKDKMATYLKKVLEKNITEL